MGKHLRTKHPLDIDAKDKVEVQKVEVEKRKLQPTIAQFQESKRKYPDDSNRKQEIDRLVLRMMVRDLQPFSVVEDEGFKDLIRGLDPRYNLPSRRTITHTLLPDLYKEQRARVMFGLQEAKYVAITTDTWTSRVTESYLTVTAHYIDDEWNLKCHVLETLQMTTAHTSANLASELKTIFESWNIQDKICRIVTDNAANIVKAVTDLKYQHLPCFAHTLNLTVKDGIKQTGELTVVLKKIKDIVAFFNHSTSATSKLNEIQKQQNVAERKLIQEVETRWNSTFYMLERYCQQQKTLGWMNKSSLILSAEENIEAELAVATLRPFDQATTEMSTEKTTSFSKVILMKRGIQGCLSADPKAKDFPLSINLQKALRTRFPNREERAVMATSTFLDPRLKHLGFSMESGIHKAESEIIAQMKKKEYEMSKNEETNNSFLSLPTTSTVEPPQKLSGIWAKFDQKAQKHIKDFSKFTVRPQVEMTRYKQEPLIYRECDPLQWWKEKRVYVWSDEGCG